MTHDEIDQITAKLYSRLKSIPGVDKIFIQKCLQGITALGDNEVDEKIKFLMGMF